MSVTPNTTIQLMVVPWSSNYQDLRYFASQSSQESWFDGRSKKTYTGMQGVKVGTSYTVKGEYNEISKYNYMRFYNSQYGNGKWFYAFIDRVEHRSEGSTDIIFTLDYWQTYLFDITFGQAFIERQHTKDDTVPRTEEPIGAGDLAYQYKTSMWSGKMEYVLCASSSDEGGTARVQNMGHAVAEGLYLYTTYNIEESNKLKWLQDRIDNYADRAGDLKAIYAMPRDSFNPKGNLIASYTAGGTMSISKPTKIGSFTPRNKKSLYYPYCYAVLTNNQGSSQVFKFENCNENTIQFRASGRVSATPTFVCLATNMKDDNDNYSPVYLNGAPSVSASTSYFNGYMQRNEMDMGMQLGSVAVQGAVALATNGASLATGVGVGGNIASTVMSQISGANQASYAPNPTQIAGSSIPFLADLNKYNFSLYLVRCRESYMRQVDDFFTRFGYNYQRIGKPTPTNRSSYYYCQTQGAVVRGVIPQEGRILLENALNRGVTFWHIDDIGNYSATNN